MELKNKISFNSILYYTMKVADDNGAEGDF